MSGMLEALIAIVVIAVMGFGIFGFLILGKVSRDQSKAEANAGLALDALFDGRPDVTFSGHMRSMKYETVILGAKQRGYKLATQAGDPKGAFTLIFEKT